MHGLDTRVLDLELTAQTLVQQFSLEFNCAVRQSITQVGRRQRGFMQQELQQQRCYNRVERGKGGTECLCRLVGRGGGKAGAATRTKCGKGCWMG